MTSCTKTLLDGFPVRNRAASSLNAMGCSLVDPGRFRHSRPFHLHRSGLQDPLLLRVGFSPG